MTICFEESCPRGSPAEVAGDASSWNRTLVDSVTQKPLGDGAAGQEAGVLEHGEAAEGTAGPGKPGRGPAPWSKPTQGPAWQNETTAPAARQKDMVENTAGQNQTGESAGQNKTEAIQTVHDGLNESSDWGNVSDTPQFVQINVSSTSEHSGSRIVAQGLENVFSLILRISYFFLLERLQGAVLSKCFSPQRVCLVYCHRALCCHPSYSPRHVHLIRIYS